MARTGLGDYDAGLRALEEGLQLCEKLDNELEINRLLNTLGMVYMQCGAFDAGLAFSTRGLEIARRSRHATGFERVAFNLVAWRLQQAISSPVLKASPASNAPHCMYTMPRY